MELIRMHPGHLIRSGRIHRHAVDWQRQRQRHVAPTGADKLAVFVRDPVNDGARGGRAVLDQ
jgi:hypothetical protein